MEDRVCASAAAIAQLGWGRGWFASSLLALPVHAQGAPTLKFRWPLNVPAGTKLYLQNWVVDPAGPLGFSASNGLELVAQ